MKISPLNLILSILLTSILYYIVLFSPVVDNPTIVLRVIVTLILVGSGFVFWVILLYFLLTKLEKRIK